MTGPMAGPMAGPMTGPMAGPTERPRVVLFRANSIDSDSRAKKFALTLSRLGYDVVVLSAEQHGADTAERRIGPVRVIPVIMTRSQRDMQLHKLAARRRRRFRFIDWTGQDEYVTQVAELKQRVRGARTRATTLVRGTGPARTPALRPVLAAAWSARYVAGMVRLRARTLRWRAQWAVNVGHRLAWRRWDAVRQESSILATTRGMLPEVDDYAASFAPVLDALAPDVIHAHHPAVLGTAVRAARRRRAAGEMCQVVYDAREDFLGIPKQEQGHWRRHSVLVREEARYIRRADAVVTVSEPITVTLQRRYRLASAPVLVLNVPVDDPRTRPDSPGLAGTPTVRDAAGLAPGVPLIVYSGAVSRARGVDQMIAALPSLPGVHAVVVPVPHPHPHQGELVDQATALGVADRLHFCPPVGQDRLLHYLSGADVGVMPLRTGSANIEQALPNKLFENLHAGVTMVTSDATLMKAFVIGNDLGEVFRDGDPADLAAAVSRALAHPRDADGPSWQALRARYSWQGQEATIRDLYTRLAAAPDPAGIDLPEFGSLAVTENRAEAAVLPRAEKRSRPRADPTQTPAVGQSYDQEGADRDRGGPFEDELDVEEPVGVDNPADAVEPVGAAYRRPGPQPVPVDRRSS
jgi:glycosyltransferase involved in cell wall biosynthesis